MSVDQQTRIWLMRSRAVVSAQLPAMLALSIGQESADVVSDRCDCQSSVVCAMYWLIAAREHEDDRAVMCVGRADRQRGGTWRRCGRE